MVVNHLPTPVRYALLLNQSYDGNPLGPAERVFLKDMRTHESVPVEAEQVIAALWRNGEVPEWIDINVESADEQWTLLNLRCCGRFTTSDDLLYHQTEGHPPFHVHSPVLPPGRWTSKSRERFDLLWRRKKMDQDMGSLYPDVTEHGSLGRLLNALVSANGCELKVRGYEQDGHSPWWANAKKGGRSVSLTVATMERSFSADYWDRGVELANLRTPDVGLIVRSMQAWCVNRSAAGDLVAITPHVKFDPDHVAAFEAGPVAFTSGRWAKLLKAAVEAPQNEQLLPAVRAAIGTPELKRLFPYTSMMRLGFSRCTGYPFSGDCPLIVPILRTETFQVLSGSGKAVGKGDAQEAVSLAVQHLPTGCSAAVHGTADELSESDKERDDPDQQ